MAHSLQLDRTLFLQIAKARRPFPGAQEASAIYHATIERYDRETGRGGASGVPGCEIVTESGEVVAHISYNGRVWSGPVGNYAPGVEPIYCPSMAA